MIKLVLTDMDNTLLAPGHQVTDRALAAIHSLIDQGIYFGPASGRDYESVLESFRGDKACMQTALLSNGKKIYVGGSLVNQTAVDRDSIVTMAKVVHDLPGVYVSGRGDGGAFVCARDKESLMGTTWGCRQVNELVEPDDVPTFPIITVGLHFDAGSEGLDKDSWANQVRAACPKLDLISPGGRMFDVVPHGWSKASGVRVLQILLAVNADEIVAFGDSDNDLQMLTVVGHSAAVASGNEAVQRVAKYHVGPSTEDGVGRALEQLANRGEAAFDLWQQTDTRRQANAQQ